MEMDINNEPVDFIDFSKTTFYNGLNANYGRIPVNLELLLELIEFHEENTEYKSGGIKIQLYIGMEKLYAVNNIGRFIESLTNAENFHFGRNFIFEPSKMYFDSPANKVLEFLHLLSVRRQYNTMALDIDSRNLYADSVILNESETGIFLDSIWSELADINYLKLNRQSNISGFQNDVNIKIDIRKKDNINIMSADYSEYGSFIPVTIDFRYIFFYDKKIIAKLAENQREMFINLYKFRNDSNIVTFSISDSEKRFFRKNFLDKIDKLDKLDKSDKRGFKISMDSQTQKEIAEDTLISKVYFDIADTITNNGIASMVEFHYPGKNKIINPLGDTDITNADKSFREPENEKNVLNEIKSYGFKEYGKLFLLSDIDKIILLLTDKLVNLKKISEVYYSADFKKLNVKNLSLDDLGFSLSEDGMLIHMDINLENVTDDELLGLLDSIMKNKKYYRLRNGSIINLQSVESGKLIDFINSLDIKKVKDGVFEIPINKGLFIENYLKENGIDIENTGNTKNTADPKFLKFADFIKDIAAEPPFEIDEPLKSKLRDYQITGIKWLKSMARFRFGGILADDMGLGKTVQTLAFLSSLSSELYNLSDLSSAGEKRFPALVVTPTSAIYNWKIEAEKFTPNLRTLVITGVKDKRTFLISQADNYDLLITSYGALKNDLEDYKNISFAYVFIDEAQNIKNPMTLNAGSVKSLRAKCRFALTGTPIENRLSELWSIFDAIMPGYLFDYGKFQTVYEEPIMKHLNSDKMKALSNAVKPFILRRMKRDVLKELPDKTETNYICEMTDDQKKLYAAFYKNFKNELAAEIDEHGVNNGIERNRIKIFAALTRLRQICAHPSSFIEDYEGGSGKLDAAVEIASSAVSSGHDVLLFSQFTKVLKIIKAEFENNGINCYYLDGSMSAEDRMIEIENFNSDKESVFLISLKAGGTGLNLTKADIVIHFDPSWNPASENQASDRAYRIGQKNAVQVYKLLTEGTIEEKIVSLQERKKDLTENVLSKGETFIENLSEEEIRGLFEI